MDPALYQQHQQRQYSNYGGHEARHGHPNDPRHRVDMRQSQDRTRFNGHPPMQHPPHGFSPSTNPSALHRPHMEPSHPHVHHGLRDHPGERGMAEKMHFEQGMGASSAIAPNSHPLPPMSGGTQGVNTSHSNVAPIARPKSSFIPPPPPPFQRESVKELVQIPAELAAFAADPKFQYITMRVKEQTMVNSIVLNRISDGFVESVVIDAPSKESAQLARNLIETHLKLQMKVKAAENRLQRVQTDLFSAQGEIASGQRVDFSVPPDLIGMIIGKKGARIKQIEQSTGVNSINVSDDGRISVFGPDSESVQKARELVELREGSLPISELQTEWLNSRFNAGTLTEIKSGSGLIVARVSKERQCIDCIGTASALSMAEYLLATQLEYVDKQIEIEAAERETREKLHQMHKQFGFNSGRRGMREDGPSDGRFAERFERGADRYDRGDRGGRGDRGDRRQEAVDSARGGGAPLGVAAKASREIVVSHPASSAPAPSVVLDTKGSTTKAVNDALDSLITTPSPAAGSATQTSGSAGGNKGGKSKAAKKDRVVEIVPATKDSTEAAPLPVSVTTQSGSKESSKAEKDSRETRSSRNKTGNTNAAAPTAAPGPATSAAASSSNEVGSATVSSAAASATAEAARGKAGARKGKTASKSPAEEGSSLQVIPPPPVLAVPAASAPQPASTSAAAPSAPTTGGGNQKRKEKSVPKSAIPESKSEQTQKESMLEKINQPFLKAQKATSASESNAASITEQAAVPSLSRSSPRSLVPQMATALSSARPSGAPQESRSATTNGTNNRRRKNRSSQSNDGNTLSATMQDLDLAADRSAAPPAKEDRVEKEAKLAMESKPAEPPLPPRPKRAGPPPTPGATAIVATPPGLSEGSAQT